MKFRIRGKGNSYISGFFEIKLMKKIILDEDLKYIDGKGNLLRSKMELSFSKLLSFLEKDYQYNFLIRLSNGREVPVDFKVENKFIEILDSEKDLDKFNEIKKNNPDLDIIAIGKSKFGVKSDDFETISFIDSEKDQIGSIFLEDSSLAFDYAHILPLVEKCSILHGHTSTVMVEIIGKMVNNLVIDFSEAKKIIKDTLSILDHKFFINKEYVYKEDSIHYYISFDGPRGFFNLQLPKDTTFLMPGEATVENLSSIIIKLLSSKMPPNIEALGVYIYEGVNKGAHILANIK
ncbi:MAG: 6-pyruvoyl trahydropterin synthase family protein [Nitrososphaeraceae archaeon]